MPGLFQELRRRNVVPVTLAYLAFDGELSDIFAVQDEISRLVVEGLKLQLLGDSTPTVQVAANIEAYNEYLLGRYQLAMRTPVGIEQASLHFKAALELDPA